MDTEAIFKEFVEPNFGCLENGQNLNLIAFGYSGTGKTYTISGLLEYIFNYIQGLPIANSVALVMIRIQ